MLARPTMRASRLCVRCYATGTSTTPPMLLKIRKDLKTAMQQKDTTRLAVLRALLSQTLNASKTSSPINTDMQVLSLLRKNAAASKSASEEFAAAGRQDLADKENAQISIMEEYSASVQFVGPKEINEVVRNVVCDMRANYDEMNMGTVMKRVFASEADGGFGEKPVEKGEVAKVVKAMLEEEG